MFLDITTVSCDTLHVQLLS